MNNLYANYNIKYDCLSVAQIFPSGKILNRGRKVNDVLAFGKDKVNAYQCLNPMKPGKFYNGYPYIHRGQDDIQCLRYCYMDIDAYHLENSELSDLTAESIYALMKEEGIFGIVPEPTGILYSGKGFWLLWAINEHKNAIPRWLKVQERLFNVLKEYGADPSCVTDSARLCRIPGSINGKNGAVTRYEEISGNIYTLHELLEYLPAVAKKNKSSQKNTDGEVVSYTKFNVKNPININRARDLAYLLRHNRDYVGMREVILFLYRYHLRLAGIDEAEALKLTLKLNNSLKHPLEEDVAQATASADRAINGDEARYRYTNERLIQMLRISEEEQKHLKTIISDEERLWRLKKRKHKEYVHRLHTNGLGTKSEHKAIQISKIKELIKKRLSAGEIQKALSLSKSTYYRYMQEIGEVLGNVKNRENTVSTDSPKISPTNIKKKNYVVVQFCVDTNDTTGDMSLSASGGGHRAVCAKPTVRLYRSLARGKP